MPSERMVPTDLEAVGPAFSADQLYDVRARTRTAMAEIAAAMVPGMVEEDARKVASEVLWAHGLRKGWHKILVRFGPNTTKNFEDPSEPGVVLGQDDIYFVDIGPIHEGCEGDAGATFAVGTDTEMRRAAADVHQLWWAVRQKWVDEQLTGMALYDYADRTAAAMGWRLDLELTGHRLGDFPHEAHYDGTLSAVGFRPASGLWVLEIQIRHPEREFGAFFEDLLIEDDGLQRTFHP